MSVQDEIIDEVIDKAYEHGFVTDIEADTFPPGLDESVIRRISAKKNEPEFLLNWRLKAFEHWKTQVHPKWAHVDFDPIG